jgi:hypothetical protein
MVPSTLVSRSLHLFGVFLSLTGLIFVALRIQSYAGQIDFSRLNESIWFLIGLLSILYGTSNLLLARAWWYLLVFWGVAVRWTWAVRIYGLSQIAKYVPGNIFHLAGRQTFGLAAGLPAKAFAKSVFWELALLSLSGILFLLFVLPLYLPWTSAMGSILLFSITLLALAFLLRKTASFQVAAALLLQVAFLFLSGLMFFFLIRAASGDVELPPFSTVCGAFVTAWLAGFVTPGAPAGVGIREMVLLFLLEGPIPEADLLLAVLLGRGVTVLGDLCYCLMSIALKPQNE